MQKAEQHEELKQLCLKCSACTLAEQRKQVVFAEGNINADLMLIGEAPGADEDEQGIPFIGRAGKLLTQMLEAVDIKRGEDTYITNICKCRPPANRNPEKEEVNSCHHWLKEQIAIIKPKIIVLVGAVAMKALLGEQMTISKERGAWHTYEGVDTTIIFHPAYLLRNPSKEVGKPKWITWQDLKAIKSAIEFKKLEEVNA